MEIIGLPRDVEPETHKVKGGRNQNSINIGIINSPVNLFLYH